MEKSTIFKCFVCGREFSALNGLSYHITHTHNMSLEKYYLDYICEDLSTAGKCCICGNKTPFKSIITGYQKCCSFSCGGKYGTIKGKETCLQKYGKKALNNPDKIKDFYLNNPEIKVNAYKKMVNTKILNDTLHNMSTLGLQKKKEYIDNFESINDCTMVYSLVYKYGQGWYKANILEPSDYIYSDYKHWNLHFIKNSAIYKIEKYCDENKLNQSSHGEKSVVDFVKTIYTGEILENTKTVISPYELDIYIPDKKIAIEYNGTYYHSIQAGTDKKYHFNKSKMCEDLGIRLIHVYEYQWQDSIKKEIIKSIIKNSLDVNNFKIFGRKCEIKELTKKDVEDFSNINSLHGHRNASIYLGLFYNNELVELMSFGHAYFSKDTSIDYECIRSITKLNTTVVGGMNKLFTYFIKKYNPNKVLYYVDYNTHIGNSMSKLNFKFISYSGGGIINIANNAEVVKKYGYVFNRKPSNNKDIKQLTNNNRILTIVDAGVKKYIWTKTV